MNQPHFTICLGAIEIGANLSTIIVALIGAITTYFGRRTLHVSQRNAETLSEIKETISPSNGTHLVPIRPNPGQSHPGAE